MVTVCVSRPASIVITGHRGSRVLILSHLLLLHPYL